MRDLFPNEGVCQFSLLCVHLTGTSAEALQQVVSLKAATAAGPILHNKHYFCMQEEPDPSHLVNGPLMGKRERSWLFMKKLGTAQRRPGKAKNEVLAALP